MNIRELKIYALSATVGLLSASCLDKYPDDSIRMDQAINTTEDINQLAIGIYSAFKSSALYSGALTLLPDLQTDFLFSVKESNNTYGDIWRWDQIKATDTNIESVYGALYDVVNRCNFLLDNVEKVKATVTNDDDLDKIDQYCGEAYFARALAYSELLKCFCKPYDSDEDAEQQLGVVLTEHYNDASEPMKRASLKASYDFVLADISRATKLLKLDDDFDTSTYGVLYDTSYFNEYTCHALRARVYLNMRKWEEAITYSTKVIESGYYTLSSCNTEITSGISYYQYMWSYDHSTECIWKVESTLNSYGGSLGQIFFNYDNVSYKPEYVPATWVINLYTSSDLRASCIFRTATTGYSHGLQWPLLYKYYGNQEIFTPYLIYGVCMPKVFRLSEQYLIRAEAYVQKSVPNYSQAGKDITSLREARYSSYGGNTALNKTNAMDVIEEERVKELYMEGFRLNDLKRWHKGFERNLSDQDKEYFTQSGLKVEKDDPLFVWPIPQHELEAPGSEIQPNDSNK